MKTDTTKELERLIFYQSKADQAGIYGAFEVALGEAYGNEYVDYMTMSSTGEFRCYEIKQSYNDLHSKAKLSFYGDYNYLVMTEELYEEILAKGQKDWWNVSIYIRKYTARDNRPVLKLVKKAPKRTVAPWKRYELTHCMVRSLSRLTTEKMNCLKLVAEAPEKATAESKRIPCPICDEMPKVIKHTEGDKTTYKMTCPNHPNFFPFMPSRSLALFCWNHQESKHVQQALEEKQKEAEEMLKDTTQEKD